MSISQLTEAQKQEEYLMFWLEKDVDNLSIEQLQEIIPYLDNALDEHVPNGHYEDSVITDFLAENLSLVKKRLAKLTNN